MSHTAAPAPVRLIPADAGSPFASAFACLAPPPLVREMAVDGGEMFALHVVRRLAFVDLLRRRHLVLDADTLAQALAAVLGAAFAGIDGFEVAVAEDVHQDRELRLMSRSGFVWLASGDFAVVVDARRLQDTAVRAGLRA
ncbi:hypothetical protein [Microbacterium sp. No. 7]|uniref:hypothetical protein n=1 Tax=Microbacterium sp. No. 7 TaxID=1714373 RepID=UPI0006D21C9C|nr:hypothetical protein [Microbacterium sp. No. 7]ALJ20648.1 hypothetical protein AOA12_12355 [Microbacterium sp. No. 7]